MGNSLARDFTFFSLLRFTLPTVCMMVFFSLYTIVDGMFVARFIGENALAATNIVYPVINVVLGAAIMFATGGSALVAKTMGEGEALLAKRRFTFIVATAAVLGTALACLFLAFLPQVVRALGATEVLYADCYVYAAIMSAFAPVVILKILFDYFLVTAGKPKLGLYSALLGGVSNIALDYVLIVLCGMGIAGAAWATGIGYAIPCLIGLVYFARKGKTLHFVRPQAEIRAIATVCGNGYSEMVTQLSMALTTYLFNWIMLRYLGESGVAAITIVLYAEFLLTSAFLGFSSGAAPIVSYNYGSGNRPRLRRLLRHAYAAVLVSSLAIFLLAEAGAPRLVGMFADAGTEVYEITLHGFRLFAVGFLCSGMNIFSSGMFTALSNGRISALLSFLRNFAWILLFMAILPTLVGANGIWLVVPAADFAALFATLYCLRSYRMLEGYL